MAEDVTLAVEAFLDAYHAGHSPDPAEYAARAGEAADEAAAMIHAFLLTSAVREPERGAVDRLLAQPAFADLSLLLPPSERSFASVLTALRVAVEPRRARFAARLADALGLGARAAKVKRLYADLENGVLDPEGLAPRLRATLAELLHVEPVRLELPRGTAMPDGVAYARAIPAPADAPASSAARPAPEAWDEVDDLFRRAV
jgi:hypothetical protein